MYIRRHLAKNPFICDCNLRWLADYLHKNPIETSGARCESPKRMHRRRIESLREEKFKCKYAPRATKQQSQGKTRKDEDEEEGEGEEVEVKEEYVLTLAHPLLADNNPTPNQNSLSPHPPCHRFLG